MTTASRKVLTAMRRHTRSTGAAASNTVLVVLTSRGSTIATSSVTTSPVTSAPITGGDTA